MSIRKAATKIAGAAVVRDVWIVTGVAFLLRVAVTLWAWHRVPPTADGKFYHVVAQRIASGDGYTWLWPDGVVTYAAHYPVGYPAMMAPIYWWGGPVPGLVMLMNSVIGALGTWAVYGVSMDLAQRWVASAYVRRVAFLPALFVACCPTLLAYTPALMTEGAVGALLAVSCRLALIRSLRGRRAIVLFAVVTLCVALATYLRPQSVLLAPVFGALLLFGSIRLRVAGAVLMTLGVFVCTAPWVARNCDKMDRCMFVSANGGWNLLIGTFAEGNGAWVALDGERVPSECREVYQEAAKDACFQGAGLRRIRQDMWPWLALVPAKLRATFDFTASGAEHLREAGALHEPELSWLKTAEIGWQRVMFALLALGGWRGARTSCCERASSRVERLWQLLLVVCLVGIAGGGVWWSWLPCFMLWGARLKLLKEPAVVFAWTSIGATVLVHAVFFGAGRYSMPVLFAIAPLLTLGLAQILELLPRQESSERFRRSPKSVGAREQHP